MTTLLGNRALEITSTVGDVNDYELDGPVANHYSFVGSIQNQHGGVGPWRITYFCENGLDWEIGVGVLTANAPATVSREIIEDSSNNGDRINWPAGQKNIFIQASSGQLSSLLDQERSAGVLVQSGANVYETQLPLAVDHGGTGGTTPAEARTSIDAEEAVLTTAGDIATKDQAGNTVRAGPTNGEFQVLVSGQVPGGSADAARWSGPPLPPYGILGLNVFPDVSDPNYNMRITPGGASMQVSSGMFLSGILSSDFIKKATGAWVEGSNAAGLAEGVLNFATDTQDRFLYFHMIMKDDGTVDFGWDDTHTGSVLLADTDVIAAGYKYSRRIFCHWFESDAKIRPYYMSGNSGVEVTWVDNRYFILNDQYPGAVSFVWNFDVPRAIEAVAHTYGIIWNPASTAQEMMRLVPDLLSNRQRAVLIPIPVYPSITESEITQAGYTLAPVLGSVDQSERSSFVQDVFVGDSNDGPSNQGQVRSQFGQSSSTVGIFASVSGYFDPRGDTTTNSP